MRFTYENHLCESLTAMHFYALLCNLSTAHRAGSHVRSRLPFEALEATADTGLSDFLNTHTAEKRSTALAFTANVIDVCVCYSTIRLSGSESALEPPEYVLSERFKLRFKN